jgi:hypothetical protein
MKEATYQRVSLYSCRFICEVDAVVVVLAPTWLTSANKTLVRSSHPRLDAFNDLLISYLSSMHTSTLSSLHFEGLSFTHGLTLRGLHRLQSATSCPGSVAVARHRRVFVS